MVQRNLYEVILDGDQVAFESHDRLRAFCRARHLARYSDNYVEVWYYDKDGTRRLLDFYN